MNKIMATKRYSPKKRGRYIVKEFSVIEFYDEDVDARLFECIPDSWFLNPNKTKCFWPPKCGSKSVMQRAINCERPDDTWGIYDCVVISTGHLSYAVGFKVVRDKCSQQYNTSSAEEQMNAAKFRREHPVLALQGKKSFEGVFSKQKTKIPTADVHMAGDVEKVNESNEIDESAEQVNGNRSATKTIEIDAESTILRNVTERRVSTEGIIVNSRGRCIIRSRSNSRNRLNATNRVISVEAGNEVSNNIREHLASQARSSSRNRSNSCERNVSRSRSKSNYSSDRSYSDSSSSRSRQRNSQLRCSSEHDTDSDARSAGNMSEARHSTSARQTSTNRRSTNSRNTGSKSSRAVDESFRSRSRSIHRRSTSRIQRSRSNLRRSSSCERQSGRSNHSIVSSHLRSQSRSRVRDSRSHSSFRGSGSGDASKAGIDYLIKLVEKFGKQQVEQERRFNRIEVSINKILILIGDLTNSNNISVAQPVALARRGMDDDSDEDLNEFEVPKLPILSVDELFLIQKQLKNRRFKRFLIKHEQDFCTPSKTGTHTVTLTKYLERFIKVGVRCELTLKDSTKKEYTLMGDFHRVYCFLIDLMRAGYKNRNKILTVDEAHTALRTVWSRSAQKKNEEARKKKNRQRRDDKKSRKTRQHHRRR